MDAIKAQRLGLIPPQVKTVRQVGNTSLAMARELVMTPEKLEAMSDLVFNCINSFTTFLKIYTLKTVC
jgi:uncharacterized 2Fe-2S/4Fe-4S cluster protein (DUF4445 family)